LLAHIYGVDIDLQAVEVTKLSLALKAMEGETVATINTQLKFFKRRVLPNLDNNVLCGNSLISPDFDKIDMFSTKKQRKINVLNWSDVFKKVIISGGFHCVIGNPPYRMLQLGKKQESENVDILAYYKVHYPHSFSYKVNLFALFMERMLKTLRKEGSFAFIIPNAFLNSFYYKDLRKLLLEKGGFERIYDLRYRVFEEAEVGGNVMFIYKKEEKIEQTTFLKIDNLLQNLEPEISVIQHHEFLQSATYNLNIGSADLKFDTKVRNLPNVVNLGDLAIIYQGVITGDNKKFIANEQKSEEWRKILRRRDINRYTTEYAGLYVHYVPEQLWSNTNIKMFDVPEKIISRQTSDKLIATLDTESYFSLDSTHVIHLKTSQISIRYLLGLYNSKLLNFLYQNSVKEKNKVFAQVKTVNLKPLPIKLIDFENPKEVEIYKQIEKFVTNILDLQKRLQTVHYQLEKQQLKGRITYAESQINENIYKLYDLTPEEIATIEV
jgi:hypothetical protein